jgi:hypothetical protein
MAAQAATHAIINLLIVFGNLRFSSPRSIR